MKAWILAAAVLAACATPADRAAQAQREAEEMIATYGPACQRLGYKADSDAWRDCILRLSTRDAYERYRVAPSITNCIGQHGFYQCSTF
ncbi:MAG: hypothetical protein ACM3Y9_05740 [Ignavibacteria bacterium]